MAKNSLIRFGIAEPFPVAMFALVIAVSIVILAHLGIVFWLGVTDGSPGVSSLTYTWNNFLEVFGDNRTFSVLLNTFGFAALSLIVAIAFGIPAAWLVERTDFRGKTLLFTLMTIGLLIPGFAAAMGWLFLLHPRIGLANIWLVKWFGLAEAPFNIMTIAGMGWVQGLNLAPLAFIMTAAVFRSMDPSLEEAAHTSRANFWSTMRRVTLPLAWPGILAASIYIFTIGFAAFDVPAIIGWGSRIFTFSTYLYLLASPQDTLPRYGLVAALSTVIVVLAALLSWWYGAMQQRARQYAVVTGKAYRPRILKLEKAMIPAWCFIGLYFVLSKLLPISLLAWSSVLPFFQVPSARAFSVMSFAHYASLPWDLVATGASNTAILMFLTPTATLIVSLAFSWVVMRSRIPGRQTFDFIAFLPHAVPNIVFGVGALLITLFVLQKAIPIYGTIWLLLAVFTISRLSYGTRMTNSALIQIHSELEESAQISGASTLEVFGRVLLPLLTPTLLYAWLWIALLTLRELTLAVFLSTGNNITLPVVIWSLWLGGGLGQASALAMVMLAFMIPAIVVYWVFARRKGLIAT